MILSVICKWKKYYLEKPRRRNNNAALPLPITVQNNQLIEKPDSRLNHPQQDPHDALHSLQIKFGKLAERMLELEDWKKSMAEN